MGSIYYKYLTYDNLLLIYKQVKKTCKNKRKVRKYDLNLYANIYTLLKHLLNHTYEPMPYTIFVINQSKARIVMSQEITDKIVNHFVTRFYLLPLLENKLIDSNVATRINKGTKYCDKLVLDYINILNRKRKDIFALKIDIYKYFYSIDINILLNRLNKDISDKNIIKLLKKILFETNKEYVFLKVKYINNKYNMDIPVYGNNKGLSIGAMTSQFLAIYYLNGIDHFIKEKLKCKYYVRYQDDLVLFSYDKEELKKWWNSLKEEISKLNLKLNDKSNIYNLKNGFNFVGSNYRIVNNKLVVKPNKKTLKKIKRKLNNDSSYFSKLRSSASYNGYFKRFNMSVGDSFKMDINKVYDELKEKYSDYLIMIIDGKFYDALNDDGKILHIIQNYKFIKNRSGFPVSSLIDVTDRLSLFRINYIVFNNGIEYKISFKDNHYNEYLQKALEEEELKEKKELLIEELNKCLRSHGDKYNEIYDYLVNINKNAEVD